MNDNFLGVPVEIVIIDDTLELAEVQPFSRDYPLYTANQVRITCKWGGPAAGGPEWAWVEVAVVVIIARELLEHLTSDAYKLLKDFLSNTYHKIKTRTAARWYVSGALAIAIENEARTMRVLFCLPEGLGATELRRRIELIEEHAETVLAEWEQAGIESEARLGWDDDAKRWRPSPAEREVVLRDAGLIDEETK
jgi:hypothetical protein